MSTHSHDHNIDYKAAFSVTPQDGSQVLIEGELPFELLAAERAKAIKNLGKDVKLDGFRPGNIPESVLEKHLGEMTILTEMAERAIAHHYGHIIAAHEIDAIGYPQISIKKLAKDNPLSFTATVAIVPSFTLPDYKQIAKTENLGKASSEVTDEEVEKQISEILRQKMAYDRLQEKAAKKADAEASETKTDDGTTELPTPESEAAKAEATEEEAFDPATAPLPELTDELVGTLGQPGQFTSVDDFKAKIREHLTIEKEREVTANHRAAITDAIIKETTLELPQVLIDSELNQMFAQMEEDLKRANLNFEDYLQHIKKTKEDLTTEWTPAAEKRAQLQLILNEIGKQENIEAEPEALDTQVKQLMEQYKDADERRVRIYVASVMTNEAVMKMLENQ